MKTQKYKFLRFREHRDIGFPLWPRSIGTIDAEWTKFTEKLLFLNFVFLKKFNDRHEPSPHKMTAEP